MRQPAAAALVVAAGCGLIGLATAFQPLLVPPSHSRLARTPFAISSSSGSSSRRSSPLPLPPTLPLVVAHGGQSSSSAVDRRRAAGAGAAAGARGEVGRRWQPQQPQPQQQQQRAQRLARLFLGAAALVLVTGGAARAFPGLVQGAGAGAEQLVATIAPISRMQDSLSQGPLGGRSPLAPAGVLLSWALDVVEVALEGVGGVFSVLLWPLRVLVRALVLPILGSVATLVRDPQGAAAQGALAVGAAFGWVGEALAAYLQGLAALVVATAGVAWRFVGDLLGALFNAPGLQYLDAMDPARHIPAAPAAMAFRTAQGIKLTSAFGMKEMYGRRWTVHAGKWDWAIPFWERCVMESQLARYRANWPKAAVKARFGFPEILRGPSPLLGGTLLVLTGIYLLYKGHVSSAIWIRQLQSETYGKQSWNPVTRLEEEEGAEGGEGKEGGGGDGDDKKE